MFGFTRKESFLSSGFFDGFADFHAHILPGVDDGVQSLEHALALLDHYQSIGVRSVALTPHVMEDCPRNRPAFLEKEFARLKEAYKGNVELSLAGEYMLDNAFETHLDEGSLLTVFGGHVLVETSYMGAPMAFEERLSAIHSKGYHIVLAHPERYGYMQMADYRKLKDKDVRFQLNMMALTGAHGKSAMAKARELLNKGYYDIAATDIHNLDFFIRASSHATLSPKVVKQLLGLKAK